MVMVLVPEVSPQPYPFVRHEHLLPQLLPATCGNSVLVRWVYTQTYTCMYTHSLYFNSIFVERRESSKEVEIIGGGATTENGGKETKKVS